MKKYLIILILLFSGFVMKAQDNDDTKADKIRDRMSSYIQEKLGLSKDEADKFTPVFVRYFREFRQTHRDYKDDKLILKQKIIDLRIRYRTEFRTIMNEQKANKVYVFEDQFRKEAIDIIQKQRDRVEQATQRKNLQ
jgi:hypothetical protein